jgi:hypothetical protein
VEEIKVGEYVRTPQQGFIGKLVGVIKNLFNYYKIDIGREIRRINGMSDNYIYSRDGFGLKHSSNIKDLIQAEDIVIYTINCKMTDIEIVKEHTDARTLEKSLRVGLYSLEQVDIKQILTKEKFESESYRLEE